MKQIFKYDSEGFVAAVEFLKFIESALPKDSKAVIDLANARIAESSQEVRDMFVARVGEVSILTTRGEDEIKEFLRLNRMPLAPTEEELKAKEKKKGMKKRKIEERKIL